MNNFKFEGNINGVKFTDLKEFNNALSELKNGESRNISLSYSTSWGDEQAKEKVKSGVKNGLTEFLNKFRNPDEYEGNTEREKFDVKSLSVTNNPKTHIQEILDTFNGNDSHDDLILDVLSENLYGMQQILKDRIDDLDDDEKEECVQLLNEERKFYTDLLHRTAETQAKLQKQVDELRKKINILSCAIDALSLVTEYGKDMVELIEKSKI